MITVRAGSRAIAVCLLLLMAGCSREQQDWRSAEAADTIESYGHFIQRHPESELATQARTRVAQLGEDRDWQHAGSADTVDAYRDFIAQHPNGKWAQEAHIRIENFSLGEQKGTDAASKTAAGTASPAAPHSSDAASAARTASSGVRSSGLASPGEAASPPSSAVASRAGVPTGSGGGATASAAEPRPTSAAASPPPPAKPGTTAFGIQLGAFTTEASASTQWRLLASPLRPRSPRPTRACRTRRYSLWAHLPPPSGRWRRDPGPRHLRFAAKAWPSLRRRFATLTNRVRPGYPTA